MSLELVESNVVIVAQQFNPSVLSQLWLVRHQLVQEDAFREGCIFTDSLVQVNTEEFNLVVVPPRAQFSTSVERERQQTLITEKLGHLIHTLPETPYRAVGLNLLWQLTSDEEDVAQLCRRLAFVPQSRVHQIFETEDARFGSYLSKNSFGARLELDMRPGRGKIDGGDPEDRIFLAFNYHRDIAPSEEALPIIDQLLRRWDDVLEETFQIARAAEEQ